MSVGIGFYKVETRESPTMFGFFDYHDNDPMYKQTHGLLDYFGEANYKGEYEGSGIRLAGAGISLPGGGIHLAGYGACKGMYRRQQGYGKIVGGGIGDSPLVSELEPETVEGDRLAEPETIQMKKMCIQPVKRPLILKPRICRPKQRLPGSKLKSKLMKMPTPPTSGGRRHRRSKNSLQRLFSRL